MRDSPHTTVSYREQFTVGGALVYAAAGPAFIAVLSAPALAIAFGGGAFTALVVGWLREESGGAPAETDARGDGSAETAPTRPINR